MIWVRRVRGNPTRDQAKQNTTTTKWPGEADYPASPYALGDWRTFLIILSSSHPISDVRALSGVDQKRISRFPAELAKSCRAAYDPLRTFEQRTI